MKKNAQPADPYITLMGKISSCLNWTVLNLPVYSLPYKKAGIRPQSATGYAATPSAPIGDRYEPCQIRYREKSPIKAQYESYYKAGADYASSKEK